MPLTKAKGNMYNWISHTHTHIGGECPHKCSYCYVQAIEKRFNSGKYTGPLKLIESELQVNYGKDRTIFIEHCNDMWAEDIPSQWIELILDHCRSYPDNTYVFQTKNPIRYFDYLELMPENIYLGCTIETNRPNDLSEAPLPKERALLMSNLAFIEKTFITIEPILKFDKIFAEWIDDIYPEFVNIGADSKGTGLDEPSADDIKYLIKALQSNGIEIRQKSNLERITGKII